MTNAANNAALASGRLELAMKLLVQSEHKIDELVVILNQAAIRAGEAKLPLYAAAGQVASNKGTGQTLGNAALQAENRTREILNAALNMKDAIDELRKGEGRLQTDINIWENLLRS